MAKPAHAPLRVELARPAATPATTPEHELKINISTRSFSYWEYEGTRARLEAEGVIPPGTEWPQGKKEVCWSSGRLRFRLGRTRAEWVKGPMSVWTSGDWWRLRCDAPSDIICADWRVKQKARELAQAIYDRSPEGQREWHERFNRYWATQKDAAFQAFKVALLPRCKKPGRPSGVGEAGA